MYASWRWRGVSTLQTLLCWWALLGLEDAGPRTAAGLRNVILPEEHEGFCVLLMYDVGLEPGAQIRINISTINASASPVLVILTRKQWLTWISRPLQPLKGGGYSSYLISAYRRPLSGHLDTTFSIAMPSADRYYVGVLNEPRSTLRLQGYVEYENPGGQHLPLQLVYLPETVRIASAAFVLLMLVVAMVLSIAWQRAASLLHALLVTCLWLKSAELACKWKYFDLLGKHGEASVWHYQVWQVAAKLHSISETQLLLMTALGWRVLRPRLSSMELRFVALSLSFASCLVVLQVLAINAGAAQPLMSFTLFFYTLQVSCHLLILLMMNINIQVLALYLQESPLSPNTAVLYHKHRTYIWFRRLFVVIILRPSVILWLRVSVFGAGGGEWVIASLSEGSLWCLYVGLFLTLRPAGPARLSSADAREASCLPVYASEAECLASFVRTVWAETSPRRRQCTRAGAGEAFPHCRRCSAGGPSWASRMQGRGLPQACGM
mmetsp:Transcript_53625/g.173147  ORF Transcript_53625/g.173147 Transcript_53625/m.173147 type:complete len:493 (+) Transcript_53625:139-1617(+)